ncbi:hypothetical protein [Actinacidiphila sp. ITFR-21]|uniref:hypothetical protein n=1 Tax=Actinacidiphila sp. ITFR-21 TaxID=3075199 RepID=UPI00288BCFC7|nr:hypothetical protein [Streptomyces sp. ITFR-21]WNI16640.1 hypothetical protein RLT57_14710 [Streptomyces sp. ITFR-21]
MTSPAHRIIADAAAAVIRTAMVAEGIEPAAADRISRRSVADLLADGWHITALPLHITTKETPR